MPYKISGSLNDSALIIVINNNPLSIETSSQETPDSYEISNLVSGTKTIIAVNEEGETIGFGQVTPYFVS